MKGCFAHSLAQDRSSTGQPMWFINHVIILLIQHAFVCSREANTRLCVHEWPPLLLEDGVISVISDGLCRHPRTVDRNRRFFII